MINIIRKVRIGLLHAAYHRNMRKAETARSDHDILKFKKYVYAAEDAWRKLVILMEKNKQNG
ncbi:MAG: hypothetical protein EBS34_10505 [Flavobacteriales bacterium]|nr:hypothetical protein [Flavobacteriales bacterium]